MRAKTINFERGQEPKESLKMGMHQYEDYEDFVDKKCAELGLNPEEYWNERAEWIRDSEAWEIDESRREILEHTPMEYKLAWWESDMEGWIDLKREMREMDEEFGNY